VRYSCKFAEIEVVAASSTPCVLIVADPGRVADLAEAFAEPLPQGPIDAVVSAGGDDTIELFESRKPRVVVLTATLEAGDAKSLIEALRGMVPRDELAIVLVGDDETGPIRNALDAIDMKPDRFVSRPLAAKALRFAVGSGLDNVARALGELAPAEPPVDAMQPSVPAGEEDRATLPMGSRTSTPVRGSGGPTRGISQTEDLTAASAAASEAPPTFQRSPTQPRGSMQHIPDEPGVRPSPPSLPTPPDGIKLTRTPTPQRGSGPTSIFVDTDTPFPRSGTTPRFSQPVEAGDVPPVVSSRANTRPVSPTNEPVMTRAQTHRGTGIVEPEPAAHEPNVQRAPTNRGTGITVTPPANESEQATRAALRARWEALADSFTDTDEGDDLEVTEDRTPPLAPVEIQPRKRGTTNPEFTPVPPVAPWRPAASGELREEAEIAAPSREPTLILHDDPPHARVTPPPEAAPPMPSSSHPPVDVTERSAIAERWSQPVLLSELIDRSRDSSRELLANVTGADDLTGLDELDDEIIVGHPVHTPPPHVLRGGQLQRLEDLVDGEGRSESGPLHFGPEPSLEPPARPSDERIGGRDFARQLRAKMSMMAQRLFQSDTTSQPSVDVRPRHDHHTEIDLAALGEELPLGGGVTEVGRPAMSEPVQIATSPGSWDTQVRERGLPDSGEIVRGVSDTAMILARMFAITFTGRVGFRKDDPDVERAGFTPALGIEKVVYFDQGRPVFASSNEPGDRMGELLVREGKITASQYERCQVVVAQSGRRMGEILVDFGYLKRRELLPAVRRHVEDILYSLFGWDRGHYHVTADQAASAERIRLSRHPASLVLEGIRRKLDRTTLEKVLGPSSTVIEVPDRERLGGILNTGDLAAEERTALAAFDGQADLASVARATGVDIADVLPLAWGLCVLGLANARRTETEVEESTALVGETDLAIDRERVRARWQLVAEADYFALLGVRRDATAFEIRRAYQSARRDFAPDGFPSDLRRELARELEDIASVLDEAFRVLRDDRLRQTYLSNLIE